MTSEPQKLDRPYTRKELTTIFHQMKRDCHTACKEMEGIYNAEVAKKVCSHQSLFEEDLIHRYHMNRESFNGTKRLLDTENGFLGFVDHYVQSLARHVDTCECDDCVEYVSKIIMFSSMYENTILKFAQSMTMMTKNCKGITTHLPNSFCDKIMSKIRKEPEVCEICTKNPVVCVSKKSKKFVCQDCLMTSELEEDLKEFHVQRQQESVTNMNREIEKEEEDYPTMDEIN